ncbi:MAG: hypothetical protein ACXQTO_03985, partial [Candidatus Syntropharchaeales archaeon]
KMEKLMAMLSYPLSIFNRSNPEKEKEFYKGLVKSLKAKLENWEEYKPIRAISAPLYRAFSQKIRLFACTFGRVKGGEFFKILIIEKIPAPITQPAPIEIADKRPTGFFYLLNFSHSPFPIPDSLSQIAQQISICE